MASNLKRTRRPNFTNAEVEVLAREVVGHKDLLFGEFSKSLTQVQKNQTWEAIRNSVNSVSRVDRSVKELKKKWKVLKGCTKVKASFNSNLWQGIGGRPCDVVPLTPVEELILTTVRQDDRNETLSPMPEEILPVTTFSEESVGSVSPVPGTSPGASPNRDEEYDEEEEEDSLQAPSLSFHRSGDPAEGPDMLANIYHELRTLNHLKRIEVKDGKKRLDLQREKMDIRKRELTLKEEELLLKKIKYSKLLK